MKKLLLCLSCIVLLTMPLSGTVQEQITAESSKKPITIINLSPNIKDNLMYLSLQAHFDLPDFLITALNTGIQLTFIANVETLKQRKLLPSEKILGLEWHKKLHFYALTRQYVVEDMTFDKQANFNSLKSALIFLGRYDDVPIAEKSLLVTSKATHTRVRLKLSRADLPLLLRLKSYILYPKPLSSDWHQWSL